ncbi:general substrate transporter [Meredithblackwellia eburnea MCA 4105]
MTANNGWLQFFVILFAAVGSLSYGYSAGVIATTLGQPTFITYFKLDKISNATEIISAMIVGFQCGGFVGALSAPYFADKWGRKMVLYICGTGIVVTGALQAGSVNVPMFLVFRTLGGFMVGGILVAVPTYQAEIAPANLRGRLMAMHGMMLALGYVISSWLSLAFFYLPNSNLSWRLPLAFQVVFPLLLVVGLFWLPESPRWLVAEAGRPEDARKILDLLHEDASAADPYATAHQEFQLIVDQNELEKSLDVTWGAIFRVPSYRKRALLSFFTLFLYPSTGTLCITNYLPSLLGKLHFGSAQQLALAGGYITYAPLGNIVASHLLDRLGRRKMFSIGLTGCALALIGETITINRGLSTKAGQAFGVFFFFMHLTFFATFLDATTFVYSAEIWPTHLRAKGFSIGICGLFLGAIIWLGSAGQAFATINEYFYVIFIVISVFALIMINLFWPETANVPLESMGQLFGDAVVAEELNDKQVTQHIDNVATESAGASSHSK